MAWYQDPCCRDQKGADAATDGDIDIAYALLLADRQWGSSGVIDYADEADDVIKAILEKETDNRHLYPLLGDWASPASDNDFYKSTRSSDFILSQFRSFHAATGENAFQTLVESLIKIMEQIQKKHSPGTGLMPDFIVNPATSPAPPDGRLLESSYDGSYYYNACRVPWRLGCDYLISGDERIRKILLRMNAWIKDATGGDPSMISPGYRLDGSPINGSETMAFTAPFAVSACIDSGSQKWLDSLWKKIISHPPENYYEDTLKLMSMITVSGNFWAPEKVQ